MSRARCASHSGSLPLALGTPPASRFTSKEVTSVGHMAVTGQLWMSGLGFLCCDVIGKPMMGRTWIGWTTTIMISLGKISAKAKTTMKTGIYHQ